VPSTFQIFETAERIELLSADIYRSLVERFAADPEARALFRRLEEEEMQHASRIRLMAVCYLHDSRLFGKADISALRLEEIFEEGQRALRSIAWGEWDDDLAVAKRAVADLEAKFSAAHAHILSRTADPAVREFFEKLAQQDEAHHQLLMG
jgi:rubrerythrin